MKRTVLSAFVSLVAAAVPACASSSGGIAVDVYETDAVHAPTSVTRLTPASEAALAADLSASLTKHAEGEIRDGRFYWFVVLSERQYVANVRKLADGGKSLVVKTIPDAFSLEIDPGADGSGFKAEKTLFLGGRDGFDDFSAFGETVQLPNVEKARFAGVIGPEAGSTAIVMPGAVVVVTRR